MCWFHRPNIPFSVLQWHYIYLDICLFELLCCVWPYIEDCRLENGEFLRKGNGKDCFLLRLIIEKRPSEVFLENKFLILILREKTIYAYSSILTVLFCFNVLHNEKNSLLHNYFKLKIKGQRLFSLFVLPAISIFNL